MGTKQDSIAAHLSTALMPCRICNKHPLAQSSLDSPPRQTGVIFIVMTDVYKAGFKNSLFIQLLKEQGVTTSILTILQNQV